MCQGYKRASLDMTAFSRSRGTLVCERPQMDSQLCLLLEFRYIGSATRADHQKLIGIQGPIDKLAQAPNSCAVKGRDR